MKFSPTIIEGFSDRATIEKDLANIDENLARERQWYSQAFRFQDHQAALGGLASNKLVSVQGDDNFRLIRRLRNTDLDHIYPPLLTPSAAESLKDIGDLWRKSVTELGVPAEVKLSVTSLLRSQEYQDKIVASGKLAVSDSTHVTGNAFDIDLGGYYVDLGYGREATVSLRHPVDQQNIASAFSLDLGVGGEEPHLRQGPEHFLPAVPEALKTVLFAMHDHGLINSFVEMDGTPNATVHVAPSPGLQ